ncbi:hypothetical protein M0R45_036117 [Rubus argutus]|uniref:Uncharacterized protein n=1 Tax=Rubus argutus TaxID=59490 RepID=A0AAW1VYW2_RUBAR
MTATVAGNADRIEHGKRLIGRRRRRTALGNLNPSWVHSEERRRDRAGFGSSTAGKELIGCGKNKKRKRKRRKEGRLVGVVAVLAKTHGREE